MRGRLALLAVFLALEVGAQTPSSPEMLRAVQEAERVRTLVEAGALPRNRLEQAQQALADAEDDVVLHRTLYGAVTIEELSDQQIQDMLAAARRRLDRQTARLEESKKLVEEGVAPRVSLTPVLQELDARRKTLILAESRSNLFRMLMEAAKAEAVLEETLEQAPEEAPRLAERFDGGGVFRMSDLRMIVLAYEREFGQRLPISARGATRVHRALGFDHRDRVDVALNPDQPEGVWLRRFLEQQGIPYFAFRAFIPGVSTAPHIHIGPPSARLRIAD